MEGKHSNERVQVADVVAAQISMPYETTWDFRRASKWTTAVPHCLPLQGSAPPKGSSLVWLGTVKHSEARAGQSTNADLMHGSLKAAHLAPIQGTPETGGLGATFCTKSTVKNPVGQQ